jgi:hypothetical protein
MQEQTVFNAPVSSTNGTNDLLSRLYREIGISAVAAALEINQPQEDRPLTDMHMAHMPQPAAK